MLKKIDWKAKRKAAAIHLFISITFALCGAALVFLVWYPSPYRELLWGQHIYVLLIVIDAALGPFLTFVVFNRKKGLPERLLDFSLIGCLQVGALVYGVWALSQARPVHVVFEYDKFQVVPVYLVPEYALKQASDDLQTLPIGRPTLLSLRRLPEDEADIVVWTRNMDFGGPPLAVQPKLWQKLELAKDEIDRVSMPLDQLANLYPQDLRAIQKMLDSVSTAHEQLMAVPIHSPDGKGLLILQKDELSVQDLVVLR